MHHDLEIQTGNGGQNLSLHGRFTPAVTKFLKAQEATCTSSTPACVIHQRIVERREEVEYRTGSQKRLNTL